MTGVIFSSPITRNFSGNRVSIPRSSRTTSPFLEPHDQTKLIRVLQGKILDVALDLRKGSPTYGRHLGVELSADNRRQLFIPRGFAHGFSVLSPTAEVAYKCDGFYNKASEGGIRYDDPGLGIDWQIPAGKTLVSSKDKVLPLLTDCRNNFEYKG